MKKYGYVYEKSKKAISLMISASILIVMLLFSVYSFIVKQDSFIISLIVILSIFLIVSIVGVIITIKNEPKDEAFIKGTKVQGKIIEPVVELNNDVYEYYLKVKFINPITNTEQEYQTPELNFNPCKKLAGDRCIVHIYGDRIYVSGFQIIKNKEEGPWSYLDPEDDKFPIWILAIIMGPIILLIIYAMLVSKKP